MKNKKVVIVGAGLVGALWAIFLARRGYEISVYERRGDMRTADFIGGRSINLAMSTRGWRAMEKVGLEAAIKAVSIPMQGRIMHSMEGELTTQAYGLEGQAIYSVPRAGLNIQLINIADSFSNVNFHFNQKCTGVDLQSNTLVFEDQLNKTTSKLKSDLIFGTDGAFSAVRSALQRTNRFNYSQHYLNHGYKELTIPANEDGTHRLDVNALHIWPRGDFMMIALPNTDGSFTCTLFLAFEGKFAFEHLNTDEAIRDFFQTYFADAIVHMPNLLADFHRNPTSSLVTIRCNPWRYKNQLLLLGDASHAIVPFYGQGMNSGLEDCTLLDELVEHYSDDWDKIIPHFNNTRIPDAEAIADLALRNFVEMRDSVGDPKFLLRKKIEKYLQKEYPNDFIPVYSMVTFGSTPYHIAFNELAAQDALFDKILALDNIEADWTTTAVKQVFQNWLNANKKEAVS